MDTSPGTKTSAPPRKRTVLFWVSTACAAALAGVALWMLAGNPAVLAGHPLLPGILPLTTVRTLNKTVELSGAPVPPSLAARLEPFADDPKGFRAAGIDVVTELAQRLIDEGVPGVHFYTFNMSKATTEVVERLGLLPARA